MHDAKSPVESKVAPQHLLWLHRAAATLVALALVAVSVQAEQSLAQDDVTLARERVARMPTLLAARAQTMAREHRLLVTPAAFDEAASKDATGFGIRSFSVDQLRARQLTTRHIRDPIVLQSGQRRDFGPLQVHAKNMQVAFQKGGATLRAKHMVLEVSNRSKHAVAYYVQVRMQGRGYCTARGSLHANALALLPGQEANLSVCAGSGALEISDLRSLSISELGYHYVSLLPPQVIGLDPIASRAHGPSDRCSRVPAARLAAAQSQGSIAWEDVMDYYSRHSCERFQMPMEYRHSDDALKILPYGASTAMQDALDKLSKTSEEL